MGHCPSVHGRYGSILPLKLAPTGTRFTLETRFNGESDAAIARSFDEDQLHAAFFLLHAPLWSIPGFRPSLQTNPPSPGHAQTDPTAMPTRCSGGTWCCLAREVWDTGEQRLVAVTAARLLPSESLCPSISRQGCFWWPA